MDEAGFRERQELMDAGRLGRTLDRIAHEVMERHAITQLVIVDAAGRPEGLLHLHDLLRAKIA